MQEEHSYLWINRVFPTNGVMDRARKTIADAVAAGADLSSLSRAIGKNHAYLQQFMKRGVPRKLPEEVRIPLAKILRVPENALRDGHLTSEEIAGVEGYLSSEDVAATLAGPPLRKTVKLKGYVGAGSEAHFYKITDEDFEEVPAPRNATDKTVAVQIRGKSWGPAMDTWLVFYDDVRSPVDPSMHGKPCIVGLSDDRILLKIVYPQSNGLFRLLSNSDEPPIMDADVEWAALVTGMAPRT
jgi:hypothetical protein